MPLPSNRTANPLKNIKAISSITLDYEFSTKSVVCWIFIQSLRPPPQSVTGQFCNFHRVNLHGNKPSWTHTCSAHTHGQMLQKHKSAGLNTDLTSLFFIFPQTLWTSFLFFSLLTLGFLPLRFFLFQPLPMLPLFLHSSHTLTLGGVMVGTLDLWSIGRRFNSQLGRYQVVTTWSGH